MLVLTPNPRPNLAVIEFTVNNFVSVRQGGVMRTSGMTPDVVTSLTVNTTPPKIAQPNNSTFEFTRAGGPPVSLAFVVQPEADYAAVGLIVQKLTSGSDGGGVWDQVTVGNGPNDNVVYVRNTGKPDASPPMSYEVYLLVRRRNAGDDFPIGDVGVIDPLWINR